MWYIPDSVAVFVGLRATRSCTSSTTSYAGRKKSNPTEMLGKVFPALSTAAAAAAAADVNTHPQAPRTIAADQCRHRTELLETRWPNERAGGSTGHSTPCDRVGLGCRKRWGWKSLLCSARNLPRLALKMDFQQSVFTQDVFCLSNFFPPPLIY